MNQDAEDFISSQLHVEVAYEDQYYPGVRDMLDDPIFTDRELLRSGFQELVENREWSLKYFCQLTSMDFNSDDEMYSFLSDVYEYWFNGADKEPVPPED